MGTVVLAEESCDWDVGTVVVAEESCDYRMCVVLCTVVLAEEF